MLIMALAYAKKSGDGTQCQRYVCIILYCIHLHSGLCLCGQFPLLKKWADYLATNALNTTSLYVC